MAKNLQTVARRALTPCAAEHAFRFADGGHARDLGELRRRLETASPHLVEHHRPHYHHWILDILGDPALARKTQRLANQTRITQDAYQRELLTLLDERIGKLRERVV